jgi:hypothetical protein
VSELSRKIGTMAGRVHSIATPSPRQVLSRCVRPASVAVKGKLADQFLSEQVPRVGFCKRRVGCVPVAFVASSPRSVASAYASPKSTLVSVFQYLRRAAQLNLSQRISERLVPKDSVGFVASVPAPRALRFPQALPVASRVPVTRH